jgi:hypothetical protein
MLKFPLALVAVSGVILTLATATAAQTLQTFPPNLPMAVACYVQQDQSWRVGYLHRVLANGDAIYITADGKLSVTLNAKGTVAMPTNRPATLDCFGKTLDELRANGRVMDPQRAR